MILVAAVESFFFRWGMASFMFARRMFLTPWKGCRQYCRQPHAPAIAHLLSCLIPLYVLRWLSPLARFFYCRISSYHGSRLYTHADCVCLPGNVFMIQRHGLRRAHTCTWHELKERNRGKQYDTTLKSATLNVTLLDSRPLLYHLLSRLKEEEEEERK